MSIRDNTLSMSQRARGYKDAHTWRDLMIGNATSRDCTEGSRRHQGNSNGEALLHSNMALDRRNLLKFSQGKKLEKIPREMWWSAWADEYQILNTILTLTNTVTLQTSCFHLTQTWATKVTQNYQNWDCNNTNMCSQHQAYSTRVHDIVQVLPYQIGRKGWCMACLSRWWHWLIWVGP